jgi:hypothetical protein
MPRITRDPTLDEMPDFESDTFRAAFTAMATEQNTLENIIQQSKDAWAADHQRKLDAWQQQQAEDAEAQRLLREQQERENEERRKAEEERTKKEKEELEKKRPKVKPFVPNKAVETESMPTPAPFAMNKVRNLDFVEVWYFTEEGCSEARHTDRTTSNAMLALTQEEGRITVTSAAAHRPSSKAIPDEKLSWRQMSIGKTGLLDAMSKEPGWPKEHVVALGTFFMEIDAHILRRRAYGEEALLKYAADVRREWHDQLKSTDSSVQPFDIGVINQRRYMKTF